MQSKTLQKYLHEFTNLRIDRAHGNAPHQPVLLLTVIEMIEQKQIEINEIVPSPHLVEVFLKYWNCVPDKKPNPALPFFPSKEPQFLASSPKSGL